MYSKVVYAPLSRNPILKDLDWGAQRTRFKKDRPVGSDVRVPDEFVLYVVNNRKHIILNHNYSIVNAKYNTRYNYATGLYAIVPHFVNYKATKHSRCRLEYVFEVHITKFG